MDYTQKSMNIILTGSLAFDRIMNFPGYFREHILPDKIHSLSVSFNIDRFEEQRGGTAGNIAYSLALLGEKPIIIAAAGKDFNGYKNHLEKFGLVTEAIEVLVTVPTAAAYIITDKDDNQITGFHVGAMGEETHAKITDYADQNGLVCLSAGNKKDMLRYAQECRSAGVKFIFDPGQTLPFLAPAEIKAILDGAMMMIVNDYELQMIINRTKLSENDLLDKVGALVVTLGKKGSVIKKRDGSGVTQWRIAAGRSDIVKDPTGAGDAYRAGIIKGLAAGLSLEQCGRLGATAAVYAVEHYGTQEHNYTLAEFCERYKNNFQEECPLLAGNA